jgi:2-amino-4-hydroxy-6-hydroxymethyldihydropteridine diphosphokinase
MNGVFLGIGTNLGDKENNLKESITGIEKTIGIVKRSSSVYETESWGFKSEDDFLNMVIKIETDLVPAQLIRRILDLELLLGRIRSEKQYSSRIIDIDILFYNDLVISEKTLTIPHPLLHERKFVLVPLCEIEPELIHPVLKKTVASLLKTCKDQSNVRKYESKS